MIDRQRHTKEREREIEGERGITVHGGLDVISINHKTGANLHIPLYVSGVFSKKVSTSF